MRACHSSPKELRGWTHASSLWRHFCCLQEAGRAVYRPVLPLSYSWHVLVCFSSELPSLVCSGPSTEQICASYAKASHWFNPALAFLSCPSHRNGIPPFGLARPAVGG